MSQVDTTHVYGLKRLRAEYLERHPGGGDFKAFLQRFDNLREAVKGDHGPVRFYGLTFGHVERNGRSTLGATGPEETDGAGGAESLEVSPSLPQDDAGRLALLQQAGLATGAATLQEALAELELPFMFAGREQWVQNLGRPDGAEGIDPRLENVTMESVLTEPNALNLLLGRAQDAVENGRSMADDVTYWQSLVPEWAPGVRDRLAAQGIPFSVELLSSPELNLTDPSKPLFGPNDSPKSLFGLGVDQAGERSFLRSLSAEELMTQVWPLYYQYYHRPAGSPPPAGFEAGLTFGSPVQGANGTFIRSPIMSTDVYQRWAAYNQPGTPGGGLVNDDSLGLHWDPLGGNVTYSPPTMPGPAQRRGMLEAVRTGQLTASQFAGPWSDMLLSLLGSRAAAAAISGDAGLYFAGPIAAFAPDRLGADTTARFETLQAESAQAA